MIIQYDFFRTKYGQELLIDLIRLEDLEKYIKASPVQRLSYYDITVITSGYGSLVIDLHEQPLEQETVFFPPRDRCENGTRMIPQKVMF